MTPAPAWSRCLLRRCETEALKRALLWASAFALVGLWFARGLPGVPLGAGVAGEGEGEGEGADRLAPA